MIIIDFDYALVVDHSAVAAIHGITQRYAKVDKKVLLVNLGKKCHRRLHRTGDHAILRRQITPAFHLHDAASDVEREERYTRQGRISPSHSQADTHPMSDHHEESHRIEDLPMFSAGINPLDREVDILYEEQGDFSIHSKRN